MIGKILHGRYSIIERLGGRGLSDTYLAIDKQLPSTPFCVVKRLKPHLQDARASEAISRLFNAEAETLHELGRKSDQIPGLLAYFEEDQEFFLVQEFIEGQDLSHELRPGRRLSEAEVIALLMDVLSVLQLVHQQGVIHRDIKPHNLLRQEDGKIALLDFGAVKQISTPIANLKADGQTSVLIAVGTPGYMPNEQQGGKPRFSSDIYALGIVAVQALTGLSPNQMQEHRDTGEILWREQAQVSEGLASIIDRMIRTHFIDRYKSVDEVLADLQYLQRISSEKSHISAPMTLFPSGFGSFVMPSAASSGENSANHGQLLSSTPKRLALLGLMVATSLVGYGYWRFQTLPSSRAAIVNQTPVQPTASPQSSSQAPSPSAPQGLFKLADTLTGHTGAVDTIAVSPDGKTFVSGSEDNTVKVWDAKTGALRQMLSGHTADVVSVAISRDGQMLATGSRDNTVKLWNLKTGELLHTLVHPDWVQSVAFSPDGKMLATGNRDTTVFVWNAKTGKLLCNFVGFSQPVKSVAISPNGKLLAAGSEDKTIRVWSLETEKRVYTLAQHTSPVESITMNPDGQTLITGAKDRIFVWNLKTGKVVQALPKESGLVQSLAVSPDGKTLVSSNEDSTIKLWNLQTGELLNTLSGHQDWVLSIAISPDGKTLISGSQDNAIKIWQQ